MWEIRQLILIVFFSLLSSAGSCFSKTRRQCMKPGVIHHAPDSVVPGELSFLLAYSEEVGKVREAPAASLGQSCA